jgi:hypothetical protein
LLQNLIPLMWKVPCRDIQTVAVTNPTNGFANSTRSLMESVDYLVVTFCRANISSWQPRPAQSTIKYCLSRQSEEHCKLQFSTTISWLVVSFNLQVGFLSNVFLANDSQPILSTIYFTYNALFTCISVASKRSNPPEYRKAPA